MRFKVMPRVMPIPTRLAAMIAAAMVAGKTAPPKLNCPEKTIPSSHTLRGGGPPQCPEKVMDTGTVERGCTSLESCFEMEHMDEFCKIQQSYKAQNLGEKEATEKTTAFLVQQLDAANQEFRAAKTNLQHQLDAKNTAKIEDAHIRLSNAHDQFFKTRIVLHIAIETYEALQGADSDTLTEAQAAFDKLQQCYKAQNLGEKEATTYLAGKLNTETETLRVATTHLKNQLDTKNTDEIESARIMVKIAQDRVQETRQVLPIAIETLNGLQGANSDTLTEAQAALAETTTADEHATKVLYQADCQLATHKLLVKTKQLTDSTTELLEVKPDFESSPKTIKRYALRVKENQQAMSSVREKLNALNVTADANAQAALAEAKTADENAIKVLKKATQLEPSIFGANDLPLLSSALAFTCACACVGPIIKERCFNLAYALLYQRPVDDDTQEFFEVLIPDPAVSSTEFQKFPDSVSPPYLTPITPEP